MENKKLYDSTCSICLHLQTNLSFKIREFSDSILYLNEDQFFRGYCILEYHEHIKELFHLTDKAREVFMKHVCLAAQALQKTFQADKINYELLGNKVPHLHWHIIPRFKGDPAWSDPVWTRPHDPLKLPAEQINSLIFRIQKYL